MTYIIKKDGTKEVFNPDKIKKAISLSAERIMVKLDKEVEDKVVNTVLSIIDNKPEVEVIDIHRAVELALDEAAPNVAKSYRDYRNYKISFVHMVDKVYKKEQSIKYIGDRSNANTDSALVSTKRSLIYGELNKELFKKFDLTTEELEACKDGYIYVHDMSARRDSINCCLCDIANILKDGFEMGNIWYNEPKSLDTAFDVISDVILSAASNQYGGFTVPEIDKILIPYAEKSYQKYFNEFMDIIEVYKHPNLDDIEKARSYAVNKVKRDFEQGWQGLEYKLNTVASSRGDYPFTTFTFGLSTEDFGIMASETCLRVRMNGQGKDGHKKPVLFPKLVFLYDENLHGPGKELEELFNIGIECSSKTMYPDWLSLTGEGYVPSMYKKYNKIVSPMGCVEGKEVITYVYKDKLYKDTFENMWSMINSDITDIGQSSFSDINRVIDLTNYNVKIFDAMESFVKVKYLIRNVQSNWCKVSFSNGKSITCTTDHPFHTYSRGRIYAIDLTIGDTVAFSNTDNKGMYITKITSIEFFNKEQYSYDVTTESDHFTVSGMYSYNCRAFLSPWYEKGGMEPEDENDYPVFVGRFNCGVVSINFPMIAAKAINENKDFYDVLDYYLEMIRNIHKRTYDYLGEMRASTNPLQFCEGGFYGGYLNPDDKIRPLLKYSTFSYGITALNELNRMYNGKSIKEDGQFPLEVMEYINNKLAEYKKEDNILYAVYGTPAESYCYTQVKQFRKKYGIIKNVSDKEYMSNSFHCHVSEDITPIEKQDKEYRFWNLFNGGKIQYVKYPIGYNIKAIKNLVRRAMKMGFYEGVNLSLAFCEDCGHEELNMDVCPVCGSRNLTKVERTCGYLGYSRVKGNTRFNDGKMAEIADRVSM